MKTGEGFKGFKGPDGQNEHETKPLDFALIRRLFTFTRPYAAKRNKIFIVAIFRSVQLPTMSWMIGKIIRGPIAHYDIHGIIEGALTFIAFAILTDITLHFRQLWALELGEAVVYDLRTSIFRHLQRMPMSYFNKTRLGRTITRVTSDVDYVRMGVQEIFFVSIVNFGQMIIAAAFMLYLDQALFLVVLVIAPILYGINRYFRIKLSDDVRLNQESYSRVTSNLAESVNGIRVTQGFVRQETNAGFFRALINDHSFTNLKVAKTNAFFMPLLEVNSQFFIAVLLLLGGYRALNPTIHMDPGNLFSFFFLANVFFQPIQILGNMYNNAMMAMAGAERIFSLLDLKPEWEDDPQARSLADSLKGKVEFKNLSFGYDPQKLVLHDINFVVEPGQMIALVGHTGSGKTSIINLISKFYLPTSGDLLIDGIDIRKIQSESLHRQMGIVLQQNFLFGGTVMENIRFSKPEATDEEVKEAAKKMDCLDLLTALPEGFSTIVGEKGSRVSLGQRQLICFLRAMLADPKILILDEATSSVDAMTEARLQKALEALLRGRTSFVIAHRLSTIRKADLVLVLENGQILERGTHSSLLAKKGTYAQLYKQFVQMDDA
jgi:ATP-binding cassette subfamily B protein